MTLALASTRVGRALTLNVKIEQEGEAKGEGMTDAFGFPRPGGGGTQGS